MTETANEVWASPELLEATRAGTVIWLQVTGAEGRYEVSNFAQVRSWAGPYGKPRTEPLVLSACDNNDGYGCVTIFYPDGRQRYVPVHVLMAESFIGPRPGTVIEWHAGHKDDVKTHNDLTNVRWCTQSVNRLDQWDNGRLQVRQSREIDGVRHWRCTKCDTWKPESEFGRITGKNASQSRCGVQPECRTCSTARRRESRRLAAG